MQSISITGAVSSSIILRGISWNNKRVGVVYFYMAGLEEEDIGDSWEDVEEEVNHVIVT